MYYASLGLRTAAVLVDTVVLFFLLVAALGIASAAGAVDLTAYANRGLQLDQAAPGWLYALAYGLVFVYYTLFEALTASSPGKMALHLTVKMDDGSRPTGLAVVVRNLVRLPEVLFWYAPAAAACLTNPRRKRLGDLAAHTVVVRTVPAGAATPAPPLPGMGMPPVPPAPPAPWPAGPAAAQTAPADDAAKAAARLKTAALALRGAHDNYLRLSEAELARGGGEDVPLSDAYAAAWHTLTAAVAELQAASAAAAVSAAAADAGPGAHAAGGPDLEALVEALAPYFTATTDAQVQDAYLRVARADLGVSGGSDAAGPRGGEA